ncbi:hypothetical protein TNCV_318291 [Trichonephila clavipes]|nr:hypothetical protein TNCV_318291 [Trichonephila clavipes]
MITAAQYLGIIYQFVDIQIALEYSTDNLWFIKDGARPYRTAVAFDFLSEYSDDRANTLEYHTYTQSGMKRSPYSPYLIPRDLFLWL